MVPRGEEEKIISTDFEVFTPKTPERTEIPVLLQERLKKQYAADMSDTSEPHLKTAPLIPKRTKI